MIEKSQLIVLATMGVAFSIMSALAFFFDYANFVLLMTIFGFMFGYLFIKIATMNVEKKYEPGILPGYGRISYMTDNLCFIIIMLIMWLTGYSPWWVLALVLPVCGLLFFMTLNRFIEWKKNK